MRRDAIWLMGIDCRCRVGVGAEERSRRQKISIDLCLEVDARAAAERDDFRLAADYWAVEKSVRAQVQAGDCALLETLAERAAQAALKAAPAAAAVTVRAHKKPAVMPRTREVCVEIRRPR